MDNTEEDYMMTNSVRNPTPTNAKSNLMRLEIDTGD